MPPPKKIDRMPEWIRDWLKDELKARGFAGYVDLTDDLNAKLEEQGIELRVGKSAVHAFGADYEQFVKYQEEASAWAAGWMQDNGLEEEAQRHNVLFQMITTLAFKVMQNQMTQDVNEIDPKDLHFIGRLMKDVMASSGIREKLTADERNRIAQEARESAAAEVDSAAKQHGLTSDTVEKIKAQILGVSNG